MDTTNAPPTRDRRRAIKLVLVVTIPIAIVLAGLAFVLSKPRWVGEGDWSACSGVARIAPGEAAEAVARMEALNLWDYRAHVGPAFVNATGAVSSVTCSGGLATEPAGYSLVGETSDGRDHFTWQVSLSEEWGLYATAPVYLDWDSGACVFRRGGC